MVNHFRTLLLNASGSSSPGRLYPGEQYVPPSFHARTLPQPLATARRLLLGSTYDRAAANWRIQEILTAIHGCDLAGYLTDLDPRITYWPFNTSLLEKLLAGVTATKTAGAAGQHLHFVGDSSSAAERILLQWTIEVINDSQVRVTFTGSNSSAIIDYTVSSGLSSIVSLPQSDLAVRFDEGVGAAWNIEILVRPSVSLNELFFLVDRGLSDEARQYLFPDNVAEPYATFQNLYLYHDQAPYRLAGLALAVGYRINELPV